jgi:hypothetical protein
LAGYTAIEKPYWESPKRESCKLQSRGQRAENSVFSSPLIIVSAKTNSKSINRILNGLPETVIILRRRRQGMVICYITYPYHIQMLNKRLAPIKNKIVLIEKYKM